MRIFEREDSREREMNEEKRSSTFRIVITN